MVEWHELLMHVWDNGIERKDRTGVGTRSMFGLVLEVANTKDSFPAVTSKQLAVKQCFGEMAAFIQGYSDLDDFHKFGCTVWDGNATADYWKPVTPGDLGRIYGVNWREWTNCYGEVTDQLKVLVESLIYSPESRRHIVTAWNPGELQYMCLPPCHTHFQCYVENRNLDMQVYMRSVDLVLGLPFDIAGYALLQQLIAKETALDSRRLRFIFGDAHIYLNHSDALSTILSNKIKMAPLLVLAPETELFTFHPDQARLVGYAHSGKVEAKLNV